jgi:hypothetical protein
MVSVSKMLRAKQDKVEASSFFRLGKLPPQDETECVIPGLPELVPDHSLTSQPAHLAFFIEFLK